MKVDKRKISRDFKILVTITVTYLIAVGWIYIQSYVNDSGWVKLGWELLLFPLLSVYGIAIGGFSGWILIRDGFSKLTLPYASIFGAVFILTCCGLLNLWLDVHSENSVVQFQSKFLKASSFRERIMLITQVQDKLREPDLGYIEQFAFLLSPNHNALLEEDNHIEETERQELLKFMFQEGLPPTEEVLNIMGIRNADLFATQLLITKRKELAEINSPLVPQYSFDLAVNATAYCEEDLTLLQDKQLEIALYLWEQGHKELDTLTTLQKNRLFRLECR